MKIINYRKLKMASFFVATLVVVTVAVVRCGGSNTSNSASGVAYTQIERLGRPAINEGLILSNANLNLFNEATPAQDLTPAAQGVIAEAGAVLGLIFTNATAAGLTPTPTGAIVAGFLPDVLRINTGASIAVGTPGYTGDYYVLPAYSSTTSLMLTGGRKIEDGVINITLGYLFAGTGAGAGVANAGNDTAPWSDKLTYDQGVGACPGGTGANLSAPGHHCLIGQTAPYTSAAFPYLPNPY